jgi:hypothetical protein
VVCLEHLLLLKLDAYRSRRGSGKGSKDERDLVKILFLLARRGLDGSRLRPYLTDDDLDLLGLVEGSSEILSICGGNAHQAKELRGQVRAVVEAVSDVARQTP